MFCPFFGVNNRKWKNWIVYDSAIQLHFLWNLNTVTAQNGYTKFTISHSLQHYYFLFDIIAILMDME